jgi:segregation and condensation protein A
MAHAIKLDVFEGPIDLLLHLITRQRVDIYEVSLAAIVRDYLDAVAAVDDLDLEHATGFLVVAATLLELKSSRLLPGAADAGPDGGLLEDRDLLLARLVECATYRQAGAWLGAALDTAPYFPRAVALEDRFVALAPDVLTDVRADDLARAASAALAPRPSPSVDVSHLAPIRASVRDAIAEVAAALEHRPGVTFSALCRGIKDRMEIVVRFLALLELFKAGAVELCQADRFGDIEATWTGEVSAAAVLSSAEAYAAEPGSHP